MNKDTEQLPSWWLIDKEAEQLNDIAMDGFTDDTCGSVDEGDGIWTGLILEHKAVIQQDEQGFFDYVTYDTEEEAQKEFDRIRSIKGSS